MSEEESEIRADPFKLFMARWGFGLIFLALIILALYYFRASIPPPPEPLFISILLTCLYVCFSMTRGVIAQEIAIDKFNRRPVFLDEMIWKLVILVLLVAQLGIAGYLLYQSWKWFALVFVLSWILFFSRLVRSVGWLIIFALYFAFLRRS